MPVGETDIDKLIAGMEPVLDPPAYVFTAVPAGQPVPVTPLMRFSEAEGDTLILTEGDADRLGLVHGGAFRRISLTVHSSLEAVGLTAAFAGCLAQAGISANVVAGYYHDHIFVPADQADAAMVALTALSERV